MPGEVGNDDAVVRDEGRRDLEPAASLIADAVQEEERLALARDEGDLPVRLAAEDERE